MKILIIDDDKLTVTALQFSLTELGHTVDVAKDGDAAIEKVEDQNYDIIISDIMMPGISGLSMVSVLRNKHHCTTPIIMMSSLNNNPLVESALKAGANDFLNKPVAMELLVEKINKLQVSHS